MDSKPLTSSQRRCLQARQHSRTVAHKHVVNLRIVRIVLGGKSSLNISK